MIEETRTAPFHLRMRPTLKKATEAAAKKENRSLASWIETVLLEKLQEQGILDAAGNLK